MKLLTKYCFFFFLLLIIAGCEKPLPTELISNVPNENQPLEVEVIAQNPDDSFYGNGYDSTGIDPRPGNFASVISVSGIKTTFGTVNREHIHAEAIFFDRTNPVTSPNGKKLGFMTKKILSIRFNGIFAREVPHKVRFRTNSGIQDTTLGPKYILHRLRSIFTGDTIDFPYSSSMHCDIRLMGNNLLSFNIPTPTEITGQVITSGRRSENNIRTKIEWEGIGNGTIEIIIGGVHLQNQNVVPLFKLRVRDNGNVIIPQQVLNAIPAERFQKIVFTLNRKIENVVRENNSPILFLSQSIHSIFVDLP